jgi:2-polyprenyl-6-hydroxyphenyl methylase/3-demethylubiquinone-9 3-methyltransferase
MGPSIDAAALRFRFGENWQSFLAGLTEVQIGASERDLRKLFPNNELAGARFLDIGCGSGLSMLAAIRLGAEQVHGIDFDGASAAAARGLLSTYAPHHHWVVEQKSVFDFGDPSFDVVHSWGVLHHTGAMWRALDHVSSLVRPGRMLMVALYRRTPLCRFWEQEKRVYSQVSSGTQTIIRSIYKAAFLGAKAASGRNPFAYVRNYHSDRGMSWHNNVHDWLGGYPYESASPDELATFFQRTGFVVQRAFTKPVAAYGLFGSHCDEYVAIRAA